MKIDQIEQAVRSISQSINRDTFIYDLLLAYDISKASISRLKTGNLNLVQCEGEILWKKKLFFKEVNHDEVYTCIDEIRMDKKIMSHSPRFIIVTNYEHLISMDTKTNDTLDIRINEIAQHYQFFLPWAGIEKIQYEAENLADIKAAECMAKLYDEIQKDNKINTPTEIHNLNIFLSRLLFCFFAEDTDIFKPKGIFTTSLMKYTEEDGCDLNTFFESLFAILDTKTRTNVPIYLEKFPYVNGGLFKEKHTPFKFNKVSRKIIIDCGNLKWSEINPDIFGSMIQAVISSEHRGKLGMHYTSVPNIMKIIKPLFLDELYGELEKSRGNQKQLKSLHNRILNIKLFDPACGSGNFLIIAYKQLRILEMEIYKELSSITHQQSMAYSLIRITQFYGIEIDDFAHEIAKLSLWLAEHQMNRVFKEYFGFTNPTLPLTEGGNIIGGNATRIDWGSVCKREESKEIYILGNPPYLGARLLDDEQKMDMAVAFKNTEINYNDLDYISCWFYKASDYIQGLNAKAAFVSTNSICQGSQVAILWPTILNKNIEIDFAHQSFKWTNNAKSKAAVICVIVGLRNRQQEAKFIYNDELVSKVKNISPYLVEGKDILVSSRKTSISGLPSMSFGNMPNDGGNLLLSEVEYAEIVNANPQSKKFLRRYLGSKEFINKIVRYCIWIEEKDLDEANNIPEIKQRIDKVKIHRSNSKREATKKLSEIPFKFAEIRHKNTNAIIIPRVSSERREYIPIGFLNAKFIISDSAQAIYNAESWLAGILTSRMHMTWVKSIGGRLKNDYRYSAELCYNTFPFPNISKEQQSRITERLQDVLMEREKYAEKTLAQLYDPDLMPIGLKQAHFELDKLVDSCYRRQVFKSDEERLEHLFKLYEEMIM